MCSSDLWAPSKMVTDALDDAAPPEGDMAALALWLAGQLGAHEVLLMGDVRLAPSEAGPGVRRIG